MGSSGARTGRVFVMGGFQRTADTRLTEGNGVRWQVDELIRLCDHDGDGQVLSLSNLFLVI